MDAGEPQDFIAVAPIVLKDRKEGVAPDMNSNNPLAVEPETEKDAARADRPSTCLEFYRGQGSNDKDYLK
jgi:hypothetical protein